ncbi:MAG: C1 family peptidase [Lachnospiraceae bacterium]|nr:C1 family peptidase [Lachnospiraceae bacterium]
MKGLALEQINGFRKFYEEDKAAKTANAAMAKTELADLAYIPMNAAKLGGDFSLELPTRGITAQQKSGRCWLFAALNMLREVAADNLGLKDFQLSQNYLSFYDKLEKSNNFLEMVIENAGEPLDSRMMHYINFGIGDGGYWDMAADLVKKYGVVPQYIMPESYQSNHTEKFRKLQNSILRRDAAELRKLIAEGRDPYPRKDEMMAEIYKALCIVFGEPVTEFTYEYRDEEGDFHTIRGITPQEFYEKYIGLDLDNYIGVANSPTAKTPLGDYYEFHYMGSMADSNVHVINVTMDELQALVLKQLKDCEPVWFGCDAGAFGDRKMGIWDPDSFDYEGLIGGAKITMDKGEGLEYMESNATHAMLLIGVNFDEKGEPDRWKIENSWGKEAGKDGYFVCSQKYFRNYVYEAIINKKHLSPAQKELLSKEPVVLKPWEGGVL